MTNTETVSTERLEELLRIEIGERDRYLEGTFLWLKHDDKANAFAELITKRTLASRTQSPAEWQVEAAARVLVPVWYGGFEDQTQKEEGGWLHPPGTPNKRALDTARDVLRAASIHAPERSKEDVTVKPLEWHERVTGVQRAETIVGDYRVWTHYQADGVVFWQLSDGGIKAGGKGTEAECFAAAQADYEQRIRSALYAAPAPVPVTITDRPEVNSEREILERLAAGDEIAYSQDGDDAFFTKGDRAFVGPAIIDMRSKGYLKRIVLDPENYRGVAERDVISDAGRAALSKPGEQG